MQHANAHPQELEKFGSQAARWWDPDGDFRTLHQINPIRLNLVDRTVRLQGKNVLDVGCGGGILSEAMASRGAQVAGIDLAPDLLEVAELHSLDSGIQVEYQQISVEDLAAEKPGQYDCVTCMEMLEHVPDPGSIIRACAKLVKPGGTVFFSTLNRNPKSYLLSIVGAEYLLRMLPRGTHDYQAFIKPSELSNAAREAGLRLIGTHGIQYNPLTRHFRLGRDIDVNYIAVFQADQD